ncbi:MAG: hypothetical protein H7839_12130 [Magnetococcus sp. YQC-5]
MKFYIFIFFICQLSPPISSAWAGSGHILILNSDASVVKYTTTEKEFQAHLTLSYTSLDLGGDTRPVDTKQIQASINQLAPDVIFCIGTKALTVAQKLPTKHKLVFSSIMNWRRLPLDENTYGISNDLHVGMQVNMLHYLFPGMQRIGILYSEQFNKEWVELATIEAANAGIKIIGYPIKDVNQLDKILEERLSDLEAIWLIADPLVLANKNNVEKIFHFGEARKKPIFTYSDVFAPFGATMVMSVDLPTIARQAAMLAENLAKGMPPPKERVPDPAGSNIALNKKKILRYGLPLNKKALGAVNTFIE